MPQCGYPASFALNYGPRLFEPDLSVAKNPSINKIRKFHELRTCAWIVLKVVDRGCYEHVTFRFLFVTARCNPAMRTNTRVGYLVEPSKIGRRRTIGERPWP
jgi:hypothetical protein